MVGSRARSAEGRIVVIPRFRNAFAELHVSKRPTRSFEVPLISSDPEITLHQLNEYGVRDDEGEVYNFPVIFHYSCEQLVEANSYLLNCIAHKHTNSRPTDDVRRKAGKLLDYLLFCENQNIDWADFSVKRPSLRPTYRYYKYLIDRGDRSDAVINQYTGVIFDFFRFVSQNYREIDMNRVDTVRQIKLLIDSSSGMRTIEVEKRSQTRRTGGVSPVPIGFVRDDGEDLRPLSNSQLSELLKIIDGDEWSSIERMILKVALMTGARKQSVLTLRVKHIRQLSKATLRPDGTFVIAAGPGTGIDTKYDKPQKLYFPKQLVEDLQILVSSRMAEKRREAFRARYIKEHSNLQMPDEGDEYVFLSDQGNCYYMAKDDFRYKLVKSPPTGQVTDTIRKKLALYTSNKFPDAFTYHWLRATFAFQLYQLLKPALLSGKLQYGEEISIIQHRLHHSDRSITEHYLKLFKMESEKLETQEMYETWLFSFGSYQDLTLEVAIE